MYISACGEPGFGFSLCLLLCYAREYSIAYLSTNCRIIFWYFVWCCLAWCLKKPMLNLLRAIVTFTVSWGITNSSGGGKKSLTLVIFPIGLFGSIIFFFIVLFPLSPISGTNYPNFPTAISESHCKDLISRLPYTKKPFFLFAMFRVGVNLSLRILSFWFWICLEFRI